MVHTMRLQDKPFKAIKNGDKTIEMRLNDEKRQKIKINDLIEFENMVTLEHITVKVLNLHYFDNFKDLYNHFDKVSLGYKENEIANYKDMEQYYSQDEQSLYGVVGIEVELLTK